jgi:hypothetical protein
LCVWERCEDILIFGKKSTFVQRKCKKFTSQATSLRGRPTRLPSRHSRGPALRGPWCPTTRGARWPPAPRGASRSRVGSSKSFHFLIPRNKMPEKRLHPLSFVARIPPMPSRPSSIDPRKGSRRVDPFVSSISCRARGVHRVRDLVSLAIMRPPRLTILLPNKMGLTNHDNTTMPPHSPPPHTQRTGWPRSK